MNNSLVKSLLDKAYEAKGLAEAKAFVDAARLAMSEAEKVTVTLQSVSEGCLIPVIKELRQLLNIGLKEAKDMTEGLPKVLKENISLSAASTIARCIEHAGGKVSLS